MLDERSKRMLDMFLAVFQTSLDGIVITDPDNYIVDMNRSYELLTGYTREELTGKNPGVIKSGKTAPAVYEDMWDKLNNQGTWVGELVNRRKNGEEWHTLICITKAVSDGEHLGYVAIARDITERKRMEQELAALSTLDDLTGLYNHRCFHQRLAQEVAQAKYRGGQVALLMIDVDHFKECNDTCGHQVGDRVLRQVAGAVKHSLRPADMACRYGGDELAVILPGMGASGALRVAERLRAAVEKIEFRDVPQELNGTITISVGVAVCPDEATDDSSLLRMADIALYRAKDAGRNAVRINAALTGYSNKD